ncbi:MAG: hypothetical protein OXE02_04245 [Chloroflexi bacterium]|nr:hypothetical protein [Chloroflexota bacterium]
MITRSQFVEANLGVEYPILGHPKIGAVLFQQFDVALQGRYGGAVTRSM